MSFDYEIRSEEDQPDGLAPLTQAVEEIRSAVTENRSALDTRLTTELRGLTQRLDAIDLRTQRPGNGGGNSDETAAIERRAFTGYLRGGREGMQPDEVRMLRVADDTKGGFLAPPEFSTEILKGLLQISPMRQIAKVRSTSAASFIQPVLTGRPTARWVGEVEQRTGTDMTFGQAETPVHEMAAYIDVSQQLLEDAAVNVEAEVAGALSEEFGRLEAISFLNGSGIKQPLGLLNVTGIAETKSGNASGFDTIPADALITLFYSLPAPYRQNGSWLMNSLTLAAIRKLKDGQGNYMWQPALAAGQPESFLGRRIVEVIDLPDVGANAYPIWFGDFGRAYQILDRINFSILRDPYTVATQGLVRFHARRRVGGGPLLTEAVRKFKIAA